MKEQKQLQKEIGSDFWSNPVSNPQKFSIQGISRCESIEYFISGRSAIRALARNVPTKVKKVLMPAYNCESVIVPFEKEGWEIEFYGVEFNLSVDKKKLFDKIQIFSPTLIYFQSYFGFNTLEGLEEIINFCKEKDIKMVEDVTHNLFSCYQKLDVDYYVGSLRKFIALPEGGVLLERNKELNIKTKCAVENIIEVANDAFEVKKRYMQCETGVSKEAYLTKYNLLRRLINTNDELYLMNQFTRDQLNYIDYAYIKQRRIKNYTELLKGLKKIKGMHCVFQDIKESAVPLFFPVYIVGHNKRGYVQKELTKKNIFAPIIWPKYVNLGKIDSNSKYIYEHILCIPCDQRFDKEDMQFIIRTIKNIAIGTCGGGNPEC